MFYNHCNVLSTIGFYCPAILPFKVYQAKLWQLKLNWDTEPDTELIDEWLTLMEEWKGISLIMPRFTKPLPSQGIELHAFADASREALGIVIYIRKRDTNETGLLHAKALVVPNNLKPKIKKTTSGTEITQEISIP